MVIDDECDFASMDSNNAEDDEDEINTDRITATNKAIRTLLIRLRIVDLQHTTSDTQQRHTRMF